MAPRRPMIGGSVARQGCSGPCNCTSLRATLEHLHELRRGPKKDGFHDSENGYQSANGPKKDDHAKAVHKLPSNLHDVYRFVVEQILLAKDTRMQDRAVADNSNQSSVPAWHAWRRAHRLAWPARRVSRTAADSCAGRHWESFLGGGATLPGLAIVHLQGKPLSPIPSLRRPSTSVVTLFTYPGYSLARPAFLQRHHCALLPSERDPTLLWRHGSVVSSPPTTPALLSVWAASLWLLLHFSPRCGHTGAVRLRDYPSLLRYRIQTSHLHIINYLTRRSCLSGGGGLRWDSSSHILETTSQLPRPQATMEAII